MENVDKFPFPQANDFDKINSLLDISDEESLKDFQYLIKFLKVSTVRQVSYYLSAAQYIGLLDRQKKFTLFAANLIDEAFDLRRIHLCQRIISLPIFGEVFLNNYLTSSKMSLNDIAELIYSKGLLKKFSVSLRRASTVNSWLNRIEKNKNS